MPPISSFHIMKSDPDSRNLPRTCRGGDFIVSSISTTKVMMGSRAIRLHKDRNDEGATTGTIPHLPRFKNVFGIVHLLDSTET